MIYSLCCTFSFFVLKVFFSIKFYGRDNIPKKGAFILAGNHVSYLDPVALGVACPRRVNFMAKEELFSNYFTSGFMHQIHCIPVKRNSRDITALKEAIRRLNKGEPVALFPQGGRVVEDEQTFFGGAGFLAKKLNIPVIPAFIRGTDRVLPKGARRIRFCRISVHFGRQMILKKEMTYADMAQEIMGSIWQMKDEYQNS